MRSYLWIGIHHLSQDFALDRHCKGHVFEVCLALRVVLHDAAERIFDVGVAVV